MTRMLVEPALFRPPGLVSQSAKRTDRRERAAQQRICSKLEARLENVEKALQMTVRVQSPPNPSSVHGSEDSRTSSVFDVSTDVDGRFTDGGGRGPDAFDIFSDDGADEAAEKTADKSIGEPTARMKAQAACLVEVMGLGLTCMSSRAYWRASCSAEVRKEAALVIQEWWRLRDRSSVGNSTRVFARYTHMGVQTELTTSPNGVLTYVADPASLVRAAVYNATLDLQHGVLACQSRVDYLLGNGSMFSFGSDGPEGPVDRVGSLAIDAEDSFLLNSGYFEHNVQTSFSARRWELQPFDGDAVGGHLSRAKQCLDALISELTRIENNAEDKKVDPNGQPGKRAAQRARQRARAWLDSKRDRDEFLNLLADLNGFSDAIFTALEGEIHLDRPVRRSRRRRRVAWVLSEQYYERGLR